MKKIKQTTGAHVFYDTVSSLSAFYVYNAKHVCNFLFPLRRRFVSLLKEKLLISESEAFKS